MRSLYPHRLQGWTRASAILCAAIVIAASAGSAQAGITYGFKAITANAAANVAAGEAQLAVEVSDTGSNHVLFTFTNSGPVASSITDVYFEKGPLSKISSIDDTCAGVEFSKGATPPNPPGYNTLTPSFVTSSGLSADSDSPIQPNGVNPGEYLGITCNLKAGKTFTDVLNDLDDGDMRIAVHVQGFPNGGSEAFVTRGYDRPSVPAPGALLLGGLGTSLIGYLRRRRVG
jgi:hypothetical protein